MESSLLTQESRRSRRCRQRASRGRGLDQEGGRTQSMCSYLYLLQIKCARTSIANILLELEHSLYVRVQFS